MSKPIITISRQCGSGGHTIGKAVTAELGIAFYDKKIIEIVAERSGLSPQTIENEGEYSTSSILYNLATRGYSPYSADHKSNMPLADQINAYQTELLQELSEKEPCVIVGRCADYILHDKEKSLHIFIHGELEDRVHRVIEEHNIDPAQAKNHILNRDKKRSRYYKHITNQQWGLAENYDLSLNSSKLGIDRCVEIICQNAMLIKNNGN